MVLEKPVPQSQVQVPPTNKAPGIEERFTDHVEEHGRGHDGAHLAELSGGSPVLVVVTVKGVDHKWQVNQERRQ